MELHVFYVPEGSWNYKLNTISIEVVNKFISAGFIRQVFCGHVIMPEKAVFFSAEKNVSLEIYIISETLWSV